MKPHRFSWVLVAGLVALGISLPAHAQWKWRDKNGQTHISDLPPPNDIPDKDVVQRPAQTAKRAAAAMAAASPASGASAPEKARTDPDLDARLRRAEAEKQQAQKREEEREHAVKADNCARAQEQLRTLESGIRVARVNEKGEREIIDDRQRAADMQRARDIIASDCR